MNGTTWKPMLDDTVREGDSPPDELERTTGLNLIDPLISAQVLTAFQADRIESIWPEVNADSFTHPYLRAIPEHTRAYLEQEARSCLR